MVKIGFIVEGATEKIILEGSGFFSYLDSLSIAYVPEIFDAKGNGNLLPHRIGAYISSMYEAGATHIFIVTDQDQDECITNTKSRIAADHVHSITICVKTIEAWFLSDTVAMRKYLNYPDFQIEYPESIPRPFDEIKALRKAKLGKGFNDKRVLANSMVHKHAFSILRAAEHPNCNSAKYFLNKIAALAGQ